MTALTLNTNHNYPFIENGLREIFGTEMTKPHASLNGLLPTLLSITEAMKQQYGNDAMGGLFLRAGRAGFYYWMRQFSDELGWKDINFRLLPAPARIRRSITDMLAWMGREKLLNAQLSDLSDAWQISVNGLSSSDLHLDCNYFTGMLQELCSWAGGGKYYPAREIRCQQAGADRCVFLIEKKPAI